MSGTIAQNPNRQSGIIGPVASATKSASDPVYNTNPSAGVGTEWINTTSGEIFLCTNATTDSNIWIGQTNTPFISGGRGLFAGGTNTSDANIDEIGYVEISTLGNCTDFGNLATATAQIAGTSNSINDRGLIAGGEDGASQFNVIQYVTISTPSDTSDFGDLTVARTMPAGFSNNTNERGIFAGGDEAGGRSNIIGYVTINTLGNAVDFGDLTDTLRLVGGTSNGTNERGIVAGGRNASHTRVNVIQYITINTTGNATDFGDMSTTGDYVACNSNGTNERGVLAGMYNPSVFTNVIDYITISTPGNTTDFGDLTLARSGPRGSSNGPSERALWGGGYYVDSPNRTNIIDYITINSTGNAADFGDLLTAVSNHAALGNVQG